jgi:glycerol-3-phosphate acyltransferase PlsY
VFLLGYPAASALAALAAAVIVVARHRKNLVRLLSGNELKLGARLPGS